MSIRDMKRITDRSVIEEAFASAHWDFLGVDGIPSDCDDLPTEYMIRAKGRGICLLSSNGSEKESIKIHDDLTVTIKYRSDDREFSDGTKWEQKTFEVKGYWVEYDEDYPAFVVTEITIQ